MKTKNKILLFIVIAPLLISTFAGCSVQSSRLSSSAAQTASSGPTETVRAAASLPKADYREIFKNEKVTTIKAVLPNGKPWLPLAVTDSGDVYGGTSPVGNQSGSLVMFDFKTKKLETVCALTKASSIVTLCCNDNYIAWTEEVPPYGPLTVVRVYNRQTKKLVVDKRFGSSEQSADGKIALGPDYVLWDSGNASDITKSDIYKDDLTTNKISVFRKQAKVPVIGAGFIAWIGLKGDPNPDKSTCLYYENLKTNKTEPVPADTQPYNLAASGDKLVYCGFRNSGNPSAGNGGLTYGIYFYINGKTTVFENSSENPYETLGINDRYMTWIRDNTAHVYDRTLQQVISWANGELYGPSLISDQYLLWVTQANPNESAKQKEQDGIPLLNLNIVNVK